MNLCDSSWSTIVFPKLFCFLIRKKFEVYNAENGMIGQVNTSPPLHYHYQHHQPKTYAPIVALPAIFIIRTYKFGTITGYMFINRDLISFFLTKVTQDISQHTSILILAFWTFLQSSLKLFKQCLLWHLQKLFGVGVTVHGFHQQLEHLFLPFVAFFLNVKELII